MRLGYRVIAVAIRRATTCFNEAEAHAPRIPLTCSTCSQTATNWLQ